MRGATFLSALFGPTNRWVYVLVICRKPTRIDLPPPEDTLGSLPYKKVAVYSSIEQAMHDAAYEAGLEYWELPGFPDGGFRTREENEKWEPLRQAEKTKAAVAKQAMLKPDHWRHYESTDGKIVWFCPGPLANDYRIIANRVDHWAEIT